MTKISPDEFIFGRITLNDTLAIVQY